MPPGVYYTAPIFSDKDEEKEVAELTANERKSILNDVFGTTDNDYQQQQQQPSDVSFNDRNNRNNGDVERIGIVNDGTATDQSGDAPRITSEKIEEFFYVLSQVKVEEKTEFLTALLEAPDLVEEESNPVSFLLCEEGNVELAARKLCDYWKVRFKVFGKDAALKRMTLDVTTTTGEDNVNEDDSAFADDISFLKTLLDIPNYLTILPNDDFNRTVICLNKTNVAYSNYKDTTVVVKILWLVSHIALQKRSTLENGCVLIGIDTHLRWNFLSFKTIQLAVESINVLPLKMKCMHYFCSSLAISMYIPIWKFFFTKHMRRRMQMHDIMDHLKQGDSLKIVQDLSNFGFTNINNLPKAIGGKYDEKPTWIAQCEEILKQRKIKLGVYNTHEQKQKRQKSSSSESSSFLQNGNNDTHGDTHDHYNPFRNI